MDTINFSNIITGFKLVEGSSISIIPGSILIDGHAFDSRYVRNFSIIDNITHKFKIQPQHYNYIVYKYLNRCLELKKGCKNVFTRNIIATIQNSTYLIKFICDTPIKHAEFEPLFDYHCNVKTQRITWYFEDMKTYIHVDMYALYMTFEVEIEVFEKQVMLPSRISNINTLLADVNELFSNVELNSLHG